MKKYSLKFTHLPRYALTMVIDGRAKMSRFVSGVSEDVVKECIRGMLIK